jgi:50S ribosomal subunit-associated GTPase HflX
VLDASHPEWESQLKAVEDILDQLGLDKTPRLLALNKIDAFAQDGTHNTDQRPDEKPNELQNELQDERPHGLPDERPNERQRDLTKLSRRVLLESAHPGAFFISARTGEGLRELTAAIAGRIDRLRANR